MEKILASGIECKAVSGDKIKGNLLSRTAVPEDFKVIQNPIINQIARLLPLLITLFVILILIMKFLNLLDDIILGWLPIIISTYITCALCFYALYIFVEKIPETFRELWCRGIIVVSSSNSSSKSTNSKNSKVAAPMNTQLEDKFHQYIKDLEIQLNHHNQWLLGIYIVLQTILWNYPLTDLLPWTEHLDSVASWNQADWQFFIGKNWHLFNELPVLVIATFIGIMIWKMYVTSKYISKLVNEFQIEPKLGHPDTVGGLSPLGNLCIWSLTITNMPLIYLGGLLLLRALNILNNPIPDLPNYVVYSLFALSFSLFLFPVVTCFAIPVWNVHNRMIEWRNNKQERLYEVGYLINELESRLLNEIVKLDPKELENIQTQLDGLKLVYMRNEKLPVWPFKKEILVEPFISYIIPVLSLIFQFNMGFGFPK